MRCPYCAEDVKDAALVCKHCHRDLQASKPLMEAHAALTREVAELRETVTRLQGGEAAQPGQPVRTFTLGGALRRAAFYLFAYLIVPIALLIAAHWVLIVRMDVNPIYLRLFSLLVPVPFGYALCTNERQGVWAALVTGFIVGTTAVAGMSAVIGIIDGRPIIPTDRREWQELIEYSVGIMLALVTGNLLGRIGDKLQQRPAPAGPSGGGGGGPFGGGEDGLTRMFRWDMIITALGAVATAGVSIVAGLKGEAQ